MIKSVLVACFLSTALFHNAFAVSNIKQLSGESSLTLSEDLFSYDGEYGDGESETLYLRARSLDTQRERFVSQDTLGFFNRYLPFSGDPVGHIDPSGHKSIMKKVGKTFSKDVWKNGLNSKIGRDVTNGLAVAGGLIAMATSGRLAVPIVAGGLGMLSGATGLIGTNVKAHSKGWQLASAITGLAGIVVDAGAIVYNARRIYNARSVINVEETVTSEIQEAKEIIGRRVPHDRFFLSHISDCEAFSEDSIQNIILSKGNYEFFDTEGGATFKLRVNSENEYTFSNRAPNNFEIRGARLRNLIDARLAGSNSGEMSLANILDSVNRDKNWDPAILNTRQGIIANASLDYEDDLAIFNNSANMRYFGYTKADMMTTADMRDQLSKTSVMSLDESL